MLKWLAALPLAVFLIQCSRDGPTAGLEDAFEAPAQTEPGRSEKTTKSADVVPGVDGKSPGAGGGGGTDSNESFAKPFAATDPGTWTWLGPEEFDNAPKCMDGSLTGLGISRSPTGSKKVLLFMQGGGACFDGQTCAIADNALSADHMDEASFAAWAAEDGTMTIMNRDRAENPFKDWNFVFVPYCSGDVFSGANPSGFEGRPQVGFENVAAYLPRIRSTFRDADQVVLSGTSAGGYGAAYNYVQVQKAFSNLDLTVIDDSGPVFGPDFTDPCLQEKWKSTWAMDKTAPVTPFPIGEGGGGLFALVQQLVKEHPKSKFAFLSHESDLVMRFFHGIGKSFACSLPNIMSSTTFANGLREVRSMQGDNFSTYYGPGTTHQYFKDEDAELYDTEVDGVKLSSWLNDVVNGTPTKRVPADF